MKRFLRQDLVQRAIAWLCMQFMRLAWATSRWEVIGGEPPILTSGRPFIGAFWHGRMLMMPTMWRRRMPISMLVSEHADGRLISRVIARFGIDTIAGSSSNGGAAAVRTMVKTLKGGHPVVVTPDGPRGPRMRASAGLVVTARLSGAPIVPVTYSTTRGRALESWDRFLVALPFGRGVFIYGQLVEVAPDADGAALEQARQQIESQLNAITAEADRRCGRAPVEPAPTQAGDRPALGAA
ncbi:MAG TPA: lysophospholipid acyltransferase family protein [Alphaproteobacteria bacterium]|nr:lysophospholipid acyltransferase family protein [Alphaproteobacteria bacterium]